MKKVLFLPLVFLLLSLNLLGQTASFTDQKSAVLQAKEKNFIAEGGGSFTPALWSADIMYQLGFGFYGGLNLLGTYDGFAPADALPENIFTIGAGGGWGIPAKWQAPWGGFQGSGGGCFGALASKKRSYTNLSYQTGIYLNLAHTIFSAKSYSFGMHLRYIHSTFDSSRNIRGVKVAYESFASDAVYWGGTLLF